MKVNVARNEDWRKRIPADIKSHVTDKVHDCEFCKMKKTPSKKKQKATKEQSTNTDSGTLMAFGM